MRKIISTITVLLLLLSCDNFKADKYGKWAVAKDNFQGIDSLRLKGVVYDLNSNIRGFHGRGIIRLDIIETNIDFYDPRDKQANYYLIIKDGKAEVYDVIVSHLNIGDTVYIDISNRNLFYINENRSGKGRTGIGPRQFFRRIQERGYQEF